MSDFFNYKLIFQHSPGKVCRETDNPVSRKSEKQISTDMAVRTTDGSVISSMAVPVVDGLENVKKKYCENENLFNCKACHMKNRASPFNDYCTVCTDRLLDDFDSDYESDFIDAKCHCFMCASYFEMRDAVEHYSRPNLTTRYNVHANYFDLVLDNRCQRIYFSSDLYLSEFFFLLHNDLELFHFLPYDMKYMNFIILHQSRLVINCVNPLTRKAWNKLMHALNGNTELVSRTDNHGHHKPVDKKENKQKTRRRENNNKLNKNKQNQKIWVPKQREILPKVLAEPDKPRDENLRQGQIDMAAPPPQNNPVPLPPPPKINTKTAVELHSGRKYIYSFTKTGVAEVASIRDKVCFLGYFRKINLRRSVPGEFMYDSVVLSYYIFMLFVLVLFLFNQASGMDNLIDSLNYDYGQFEQLKAVRGGYDLTIMYGKRTALYLFITLLSVFDSNYLTFWIFNIFELVLCMYYAHRAYESTIKKYWVKHLCFTPYMTYVGRTYYVKTVIIGDYEDMNDAENEDLRRENDKNFKIAQQSQLLHYDEFLSKRTEYGCYNTYGRFLVQGFVEENTEVTQHLCCVELVMQMMNPKNTCMNISAESMLERLNNSTSAGPFISYDRGNGLTIDVENDSSRLAQSIALHQRWESLPTDINDLLFRRLDMMRLYHAQQEHSRF